MFKTITKLGPQDHGRPMSLKKFEHAQGQEGYLYELGRGKVVVMDVPGLQHMLLVAFLRKLITLYDVAHAGFIFMIAAGNECKILLSDLESERHPDVTVYLRPPPKGKDFWSRWIPELVIEVLSPSSRTRDLKEKPEEYLAFGSKEYWIVDDKKQEIRIQQRSRGKWVEKTLHSGDKYECALLPGLELDCSAVFAAAEVE